MFKKGDVCYILQSNCNVIQAKVLNKQGKFYIIQLVGTDGAIRLSEHRLFITAAEAAQSEKKTEEFINKNPMQLTIPDVFAGRRTNRNPHQS